MLVFGLIMLLVIVIVIIHTYWVKRSHYQLGNPSKKSFTVVQMSDLHGRVQFLNGSLSSMVNEINPDYVMITGDIISRKNQLDHVLKELRKISCPNLYFVPGNYEREGLKGNGLRKVLYSEQEYNAIIQSLQEQNITILSNSGSQVNWEDKKCLIYGFDNSIYGNERLVLTSEDIKGYDYVMMLAHSPSIINLLQEKQVSYDLLLVGHTHGGQIRILNHTIGAYKNYHIGLKQLDERGHFFINRGLGTVKIPVRLGCSPEIAVFKIGI